MVSTSIELLKKLNPLDLGDLCDATEATMLDTYCFNIGLNQWQPPLRHELESYFNGVMLIPERKLLVARLDKTIAGSLQILTPAFSNKIYNFFITIDNHFVAPWARNLGLGKKLLTFAEEYASTHKYNLVKLSVRSTREAAIALYESFDYKKWGTLDQYENVGNQIVSGFFYNKNLKKVKIKENYETV